jgi:hypothetical protein
MADKVFCRKCGREGNTISWLVTSSCLKGGNCEPYEGGVKSKYTCKKCGREGNTISWLVVNSCSKGGNCEPAC